MDALLFRLKSRFLQVSGGVSLIGVVLFLLGVSWESGSFVIRFALQVAGTVALGAGAGLVIAAWFVRSLLVED